MRSKRIVTAAGIVLALAATLNHAAAAEVLASRVTAPAQGAIERFAGAGMRDVRPHVLTAAERSKVEAALAALPAAHRAVLEKRLRNLSFVDGIPGADIGMIADVGETGQFDFTLRASLIDESLGAYLTTRERRLFEADGSGRSIVVEATGMDALTYVLLHETTHVLDVGMGITASMESPFVTGIWEGRNALTPALAGSAAATTLFRGGRPVPLGKAETIYDALAQTPFVSLYATAAATEDLAELLAWNEILQRRRGTLVITIVDGGGKVVKRYEPLGFPAVKARMARVDELLKQATT